MLLCVREAQNMADSISQQLTTLPNLSKPALCELWQQLFKTPPPDQIRKNMMVPILAYRIQEQAFGSLNAKSVQRLRQLAALDAKPGAGLPHPPSLKPGTRLVRQWQAATHVVHVEARGYEYKGSRYDSLSEIARQITGTRWSGPLFFGLKQHRKDKSTEAA